jgi:hypothetical protein
MSVYDLNNYLTILGKTPDYERIFVRAKQLIKIQKALSNVIPPQFRDRCAVGRYAEGFLSIYVDNGMIAARLRAVIPTISQKLNRTGFKISEIKIYVQPHTRSGDSENLPKLTPCLSQAAIDHLDQLAATLPTESPLKSSLEALLALGYNQSKKAP